MMDLEKIILGAVMIRPEYAPDVLGDLTVESFCPDLQPVWAAVSGLWAATGKLDAVALYARYPQIQAAVLDCIAQLEAECIRVTPDRLREWVRLLKERRALERFQALALEAANTAAAYDDLPGLYSRMGEALDIDTTGEDFQPIGDLVDDYIRHLDDKPSYIPTGIGKLDRYLQLSPGNFLLIGGRPDDAEDGKQQTDQLHQHHAQDPLQALFHGGFQP